MFVKMSIIISANFAFNIMCCGRNEFSGCGSQIIQRERLTGKIRGAMLADYSNCLNLWKDDGVLRCSRLKCNAIVGSYEKRSTKKVFLVNIRELTYMPNISYTLNSVDPVDRNLRVFLTEFFDSSKRSYRRRSLDVNNFIIVPLADQTPGILTPQVSRPPPEHISLSRGESSSTGTSLLNVRSFASLQSFGTKKIFLKRLPAIDEAGSSQGANNANNGVTSEVIASTSHCVASTSSDGAIASTSSEGNCLKKRKVDEFPTGEQKIGCDDVVPPLTNEELLSGLDCISENLDKFKRELSFLENEPTLPVLDNKDLIDFYFEQ